MSGHTHLIFIVDDEVLFLGLLGGALRAQGYIVLTYETPGAMLQAIREAKPELLITDFSMQGITGTELIKLTKDLCPQMKTILMTSAPQTPEDMVADAILEKGSEDLL